MMEYSEHGIYIESERLMAYGENTARGMHLNGITSGKEAARQLREDLRRLKRAHTALQRRQDSTPPDSAAEWLLDNWYLAVREGENALRALGYAKRLPAAETAPRICVLCSSLLRSGNGRVDADRCRLFLEGFQQITPLNRAELGIFVPALIAAAVSELAQTYQRPDPDGDYTGRLFSSLRLLGTLDLSGLLEEENWIERTLREDPAGVYPHMAESSRDEYRRRVAELAQRSGIDEYRAARRVLKLARDSQIPAARHVGYYLYRRPLGRLAVAPHGTWYVALFLLSTLFISLLLGFTVHSLLGTLLLLIPVSEVVKNLMDFLITRHIRPRHVSRMELADGIPDDAVTVCVVSALLTGEQTGPDTARRLEEFYLSNRDCGKNLLFGILADLKESNTPSLPDDEACLFAAKAAIDGLNRKYGGGFYLFYRERSFSSRDRRYCGSERKRGALLALAQLMQGEDSTLITLSGDVQRLYGAKFILTLDADTRLCPGTARELVGAMLHPLNQPVLDEDTGVVVSGYGLLHPRIATDLTSATATDFARIFAGQGGTDPYNGGCGELYMDLFDRGGFAGKGILSAEMLVKCSAHLPQGRILSHDALEGAYLHGGFVGDVELTDGFPAHAISYFKRLERWTRGDWQNAPWVFSRRGRVLSDIDRFKLFDSLRRSLVAPATFLCLLCGFLLPDAGPVVAAWAAFTALISRLLLTLAAESVRPEQERKVRYHSTVLHGVKGAVLVTAARLLLLPWEAWVTLCAICRALWRMGVSHKNLLSWETSAQSGGKHNGSAPYLSAMTPSLLTGLALIFLPCAIAGKALGILWLLSPLGAIALAKPKKAVAAAPTASDRAWLTARAAEIWQFFLDFCTPEDHYLPPDNVQEQPPKGVAHRTSPTNIGLAMTSALTAADLSLDTQVSCEDFLDRVLTTLEQMPKWHGHLYNWYDTRTLTPLTPMYVSTVDSGNLAAALVTVVAGMHDYGRQDLADRAQALFDAMDFSPLYDPSRHLFHIGMDLQTGKLSQSWYDLLSSEARLTGYVAIAKGDVPRQHWRWLSRALVAKDRYRGMVSWSGSMFEYLMPELFLPLKRDSLLYETGKFCIYVQRHRAPKGRPWGVSESAYFALDPALNYRYKAHGCAALALKRDMDMEFVVSPYSSFLALAVAPKAAIQNLHRLEQCGGLGSYGFYEALDFTPARCRMDSGETVRCYMAHHMGMSMTAIGNYLRSGANVRRFMADPAMSAHACLLEEKVPIGGTVLRRRGVEPPPQPPRIPSAGWSREGEQIRWIDPACCLLSNGSYTLLTDEAGALEASSQDVTVYAPDTVSMTVQAGNQTVSLLPDPKHSGDYKWEFSSVSASFTCETAAFSAHTTFAVAAGDRGEIRTIEVTAKQDLPDASVQLHLEPVLAFTADYQAHPAYCRLGLHARWEDNALLISRAPSEKRPTLYLAVSASVPMTIAEPLGDLAHPGLTLSVPFHLEKGSVFDLCVTLCTAVRGKTAVESSQKMLAGGRENLAALPESAAVLLHMNHTGIDGAMDLLPALRRNICSGPVPGKRALLWKYGISGDLPLLTAHMTERSQLPAAVELLKRHALLDLCGFRCDLVILCGGAGDYRHPAIQMLEQELERLGREPSIGRKGGVHLLPDSQEVVSTILPFSVKFVDLFNTIEQNIKDFVELSPTFQSSPRSAGRSQPEYQWQEDGSFSFTVHDTLPKRAWSNLLTNGTVGYVATDAGTGHLWLENAAMFRVTPWRNDPYTVTGPETLEYVSQDGTPVSVFAANDGLSCTVSYGFGWSKWEKTLPEGKVILTAFVPPQTDARVFLLESSISGGQFRWKADLVLGEHLRDTGTVDTGQEGACLTARNPASVLDSAIFRAVSDPPFSRFTCDGTSAALGRFDGQCGTGKNPCFAAEFPAGGAAVLVCGSASADTLMALTQPEAAFFALEETKAHWARLVRRLTVETPDLTADRSLNGWAVYQAIAGRILGRSSLYQAGGAFGFRDQLQDAVNMLLIDPEICRSQIPACCARQYTQGDVQHWWHPPENRGVRTRCSDDLLWLPWAVCEYVEKTGDPGLLQIEAPYLVSPPLSENEQDRYELALPGEETDTVLGHAKRALDCVLSRGEGSHGLLLMLSGDWNDGFGRVGKEGRGESVWLTWFFSQTAQRFAAILDQLGDPDGEKYRRYAQRYGSAADQNWDGAWYLRGWYDDGAPLGGRESTTCQIDSIAQSWAVMNPYADETRKHAALDNALRRLFDREHQLVKLFDPPIPPDDIRAGYISGYGPGFRENGGQYTHAALWLAQACFQAGRSDDGFAILKALWPDQRNLDEFEAEPFVIPADVYSNPNALGKCGWTWYTGSAGWYFRIFTEELLGLRLKDGTLTVTPHLPSSWHGYTARLSDGAGTVHTIVVHDGQVTIDGMDPNRAAPIQIIQKDFINN